MDLVFTCSITARVHVWNLLGKDTHGMMPCWRNSEAKSNAELYYEYGHKLLSRCRAQGHFPVDDIIQGCLGCFVMTETSLKYFGVLLILQGASYSAKWDRILYLNYVFNSLH